MTRFLPSFVIFVQSSFFFFHLLCRFKINTKVKFLRYSKAISRFLVFKFISTSISYNLINKSD